MRGYKYRKYIQMREVAFDEYKEYIKNHRKVSVEGSVGNRNPAQKRDLSPKISSSKIRLYGPFRIEGTGQHIKVIIGATGPHNSQGTLY